jgi:hypothetical protein
LSERRGLDRDRLLEGIRGRERFAGSIIKAILFKEKPEERRWWGVENRSGGKWVLAWFLLSSHRSLLEFPTATEWLLGLLGSDGNTQTKKAWSSYKWVVVQGKFAFEPEDARRV